MTATVCTLFEKDYHYGVGALVNSLYTSGYRGKFYAGYRGVLPPWAKSIQKLDDKTDLMKVGEGLEIVFIRLDTTIHFTNYKARFMLDLLDSRAKDVDQIHYFDPDIVVKCGWPTMEIWAEGGVGLSEDSFGGFGPRHPLRMMWLKYLALQGITPVRELSAYYNAGYVGIDVKHRGLLEAWVKMDEGVCDEIGSHNTLFNGSSRENPFQIPDQDALNMTLMCSDVPINATGPEGMDLLGGRNGFLLSHCTGTFKPWRKGVWERAWHGVAPEIKQRMFWRFVRKPIRIFPPMAEFWGKLKFRMAEHLSRFYMRKCS